MRACAHIRAALSGACLSLAVLLIGAASAPTARALDVPPLEARVNDYAGVLTPERARVIESQLAAYERQSGHQLALLTVKSLEGDAIEDFAFRVAEAWKLGDKARDDGLVLIVVPAERKVRIEVGYGLEGDIPDAVAARVIREIIAPAFQRGEYGLGIELAFEALMRAAGGDPGQSGAQGAEDRSLTEAPQRRPGRSLANIIPFILAILFLFSVGGGRRGGGGLLVGSMLAGMGRGMGGGGFGGGGGGGGGFRGGGGGFGGGGASGGW